MSECMYLYTSVYLNMFFVVFQNLLTVTLTFQSGVLFMLKLAYAILILWMIWNTADPQTTNRKSASNQGPTGDDSS